MAAIGVEEKDLARILCEVRRARVEDSGRRKDSLFVLQASWSLSRVVFLKVAVMTVQTVSIPYVPSGDNDVEVCMNHLPLVHDTAVTYGA